MCDWGIYDSLKTIYAQEKSWIACVVVLPMTHDVKPLKFMDKNFIL